MVSWGASVIQCMNAIEKSDRSIELIDLRTIAPMDMQSIGAFSQENGQMCRGARGSKKHSALELRSPPASWSIASFT